MRYRISNKKTFQTLLRIVRYILCKSLFIIIGTIMLKIKWVSKICRIRYKLKCDLWAVKMPFCDAYPAVHLRWFHRMPRSTMMHYNLFYMSKSCFGCFFVSISEFLGHIPNSMRIHQWNLIGFKRSEFSLHVVQSSMLEKIMHWMNVYEVNNHSICVYMHK